MKSFLATVENQIVATFHQTVAELHPEWSADRLTSEAQALAASLSPDDAACIYEEILRG